MSTGSDIFLPRPFTLNDIKVGTRLYAVLVRHAASRPGQSIFYGDLLDQARTLFTEDEELKRAVPIGIGMKLAARSSTTIRKTQWTGRRAFHRRCSTRSATCA